MKKRLVMLVIVVSLAMGITFLCGLWAVALIWSARTLGANIEYSSATINAVIFIYASVWCLVVSAMTTCIVFAQPSKSAAKMTKVKDQVARGPFASNP